MKSLLAEHKLLDVFTVGNLKCRQLDGTEVRSQIDPEEESE